VIAEPVRDRFEISEGLHIGLLLRRVRAPRRKGDFYAVSAGLRRLLDRRTPAEDDQVGKRNLLRLLAVGVRAVEVPLHRFERAQHLRQPRWLVDLPVLLGLKTDTCAVRSAALVGAAECRRRGPSGPD